MDINVIVVNVGNSRLAAGAFVAGELQQTSHAAIAQPEQYEEAISQVWEKCVHLSNVEIAGASVNPGAVETIEPLVEKITGKKVQWVGRDLELPIPVSTEKPDETGVDRILNVAAAFEQMNKACVVVDAGTAITVDVCNHQGIFLGGAIFPGVNMMLDALHEKTARLPRVAFARPEGAFGRSTGAAICQGIFHGVRGMVKEVLENYATELGAWPDLIATGGDAQTLFAEWELIHAISPDLTLYGIALAYVEHHIQHGG